MIKFGNAGIMIILVLIITLCFVVFADTVNYSTDMGLLSSAIPDHITLTWVNNPVSTQAITWRTNSTIETGVVQYSKSHELALSKSVNAKKTNLVTDLGNENLFFSSITGLDPGTTYYYRVGDGLNNWSRISSFTTEKIDQDHVEFLVFGDSQSGDITILDYQPWNTTINHAFDAHPNANFFVQIGDSSEIGSSGEHRDLWFDAGKEVLSNLPFIPVEGNHDCLDKTYNNTEPDLFKSLFYVPDNGPYKNDQIYSFDYGNVHFIVLDSQFYEEMESNPSLLQDEQAWLEQDLKNTQKEWIIAFWHKPPYSARSIITNENVKNAFTEIIDKYHVDVVFNGHDHVYSRTYPLNNDTITSTDSGTVYVITGQSGGKCYDDNMQKIWYSEYYDSQEQPIYLVIDVNGDIFNMKVYTSDETLIDNYTINKKGTDTKLPIISPPYQKTRLVINGILLNNPLVQVPPSQISGKWYLPVKSLVGFLGGTEIDSENDANITMKVQYYAGDGNPWSDRKNHVILLSNSSSMASIDSQLVELPDIITRDSKGNFLISADSFNVLCGFSWRYDINRNVLLLTNPNSFS